jgi:hypothetical protein
VDIPFMARKRSVASVSLKLTDFDLFPGGGTHRSELLAPAQADVALLGRE